MCGKDLTLRVRLECAECSDCEVCLQCVAKGEETSEHSRTHSYKAVDENHFKLLGRLHTQLILFEHDTGNLCIPEGLCESGLYVRCPPALHKQNLSSATYYTFVDYIIRWIICN